MNDFSDKLGLKEMAEEDIFFAKRDRELIEAMHERKLAEHLKLEARKEKKKAGDLEDRYAAANAAYRREPWTLGKIYRNLIDKASKLIKTKRR